MGDKISSRNAGEKFPFIGEIEDQLIPAMVVDRRMWVDLKDHVLGEYWHDEENATIFKIFKVFFERYHSFPTLAQCLDVAARKRYDAGVVGAIERTYETIGNGFSHDELAYLYDECKLFIKNNKIKVALLDSVDLLESQAFLDIEHKMKDAVNWDPEVKLGTRIEDVDSRFDELERVSSNVIPSPWRALNQILGGGFYGKELSMFASSSSVGKSIALDNIAHGSWMAGFNVVSVTLELSEARKCQRMDAAALRIPMGDVIRRKDDVANFYKSKATEAMLFVKEFPTGRMSMDDLMNYLYQLELYTGLKMRGGGKEGVNLIVVDYLDIARPNGKKTGDAYADQGMVGEEMRAVAQELDVPVVTATQLNRSNIGVSIDELTEGYLADSWRKMGIADALIALASTQEERAAGRINAKALKNRNGPKDVITPLRVVYEQLRITDIAKK